MVKTLRCKHIGPDANCQFVAHGETNEEILQQVAEHAKSIHGMTQIPEELIQAALANIQNDTAS